MRTTNNTATLYQKSNYARALMITIRAALLIFFIFSFNALIDFGTSPYLISLLASTGVLVAARLTETRLLNRGFFVGLTLIWLAYLVLTNLAIYLFSSSGTFTTFLAGQHLELGLLAFTIGAATTWMFFRWAHFLTLELIGLTAFCIYLLSPHRNYHLDSPQFINNLAWHFGVDPQSALLICAGGIIFALMLLLAFAEARNRQVAEHSESDQKRANYSLTAATIFLIFVTLFAVASGIYSRYDIQKGLVTNGVGEAGEEGSSPLGFHSALGSTNQPAALVRLEGDYSQNPFSPMLYMREGALSLFNGHELVIANRSFDTDVNNSAPTEIFSGSEDPLLENRVEVVHSVYLMADQKAAFAIDYPILIKQLKNPDPERFKSSYRAYSLAPTFNLEEISTLPIGDARWSDEVMQHYLVPHPDARYRDLALRITQDSPSAVAKAQAISNYLSTNSIYTLSPKHELKPGEDPVEPYLFGDMRGYCVHFAHATVYMLRALGIPARIATGYLTDLSQSKDGHVLLRMSDRHAWAEVYIAGLGWVPFDTQPDQVESAAETEVDMNLLEELMGKLDPGEEILPNDTLDDEENIIAPDQVYIPTVKDITIIFALLLLSIILLKGYLHYAWLIPASPRTVLNRSFRSLLLTLTEQGIPRFSGETIYEYRKRIHRTLGVDPLLISEQVNRLKYKDPETQQSGQSLGVEILKLHRIGAGTLRVIPAWKRALAFLNPLPLLGGIK